MIKYKSQKRTIKVKRKKYICIINVILDLYKDNKKLAQESENAEMRNRVISEDTKKLRILVEELRAKNTAYSKEEKILREERMNLEYEINAMTKNHEELIER